MKQERTAGLLDYLESLVREFYDPLEEGEERNPWPEIKKTLDALNKERL